MTNNPSESEGVLILNDKGQIILINPKASELFSYQEEDLINTSIEKIVEGGTSLIRQHAIPSPKNEQSDGVRNELKGIKKSSEEFPVYVSASQFKGGKELFTVVFVSETSDEQKRINSDDTELTPVIFLILDKSLNISVVNNYGCTLLGSASEKLTGLNWFENFLPLDYT